MAASYRMINKLQDEIFDPSHLDSYALLLVIGIRELQIAVISLDRYRCLFLEDYMLKDIRTSSERIEVLTQIFNDHLFVKAGFWREVKCTIKSHKFSFIPRTMYSKENAQHFFEINTSFSPKSENLYVYPHKLTDTVNVFAADRKLIHWISTLYSSKKLSVAHQGSIFVETIMHTYKSSQKVLCCLLDKRVLHICITEKRKLHYYNQFAVNSNEELFRYIALIYKQLELSGMQVVFYGTVAAASPQVSYLKSKIQQLRLGIRPKFIQYPYMFDNLAKHHYFDLFGTGLCKGFYSLN